jgi:2,4-didehydro-3-deoxy-L-rhamnonate hydrolase
MRIALIAGGIFGFVLVAALIVSVAVSRPLFEEMHDAASLDEIEIAPPALALTLARTRVNGEPRVLLVTAWRNGRVIGVDLNRRLGTGETDALALFREQGYNTLLRESLSITDVIGVAPAALDLPFDAPEQNIGVGLNYTEHARESALEEEPFLFPKFARPTAAHSTVERRGAALLDYEAEVGLVALHDIHAHATPQLGLVLANELTDRWALVRGLKRTEPMGTTGFADGKSREGFAPIGPLLVIPRNLDYFYKRIEMKLYLNARLRQHEVAGAMLWPPERIVAEMFRQAETPYRYRNQTVRLLPETGTIPAGTIIFSGTPAGVIFKPLNLWNPWVYLRPGDEVVIRADYLGVIHNRVIP